MRKINKLIIMILPILLISCVNANKAKPMKKFEDIMTEYFGEYEPKFHPAIMRPNNSLAEITILKNNISKEKMKIVEEKLKLNDWIEIERYGNYTVYCLNKFQSMRILYPTHIIEKSKNNEKISYESINSWSVFLYYDNYGVEECSSMSE